MSDEEEVQESEDVVSEFDNSPDGELKNAMQEENSSDDDFDYQQGFSGGTNYPEAPIKDSITKFYRGIIKLMSPKQVVRVANFSFKEAKNVKLLLNMADFNAREHNDLIANALRDMAVVDASVSMGKKGFIVTNIMTQRRVVSRQSDKPNPKVGSWSQGKSNQSGGQS